MRSSSTSISRQCSKRRSSRKRLRRYHLEREPAEIADPLLAHAAERAALPAERAGRRAGGGASGRRSDRSASPRPKSERPAMAAATRLAGAGDAQSCEHDERALR